MKMANISKFKIGVCQLTVTSDKSYNISMALKSIESAADHGATLILLPEMWNCPYSDEFFAKFAEDFNNKDGSSPTLSMLSEVASLRRVTIVGGSIPERCDDQLYNSCCVFGPDGSLIAKHRKMHLFDINIPGDISFKESDTFTAGSELTIVDTDVGRIGLGICHDIRFPELAMLYRTKGAHLICYPGAFNISTGESLWELEQRTSYMWLLAHHHGSRLVLIRYGVILLLLDLYEINISMSGEIVATCGHEETIVIAEVDYSAIQHSRESLPLQKQRRENIYQLVDLYEQQRLPGQ